ncbi:Uncharacterised protein [Pandoraea pnomenusa]|uniref:Uncharacterized protein n=1 Tax=Pandoraea pnomenusa TaxID=93220 RepID=A0A379KE62_9BURK|nr:Uncharacterised protein [Pandoraea pnomenusa]
MNDPLFHEFVERMRARGWRLSCHWSGNDLIFVRIH